MFSKVLGEGGKDSSKFSIFTVSLINIIFQLQHVLTVSSCDARFGLFVSAC